jgi:hypothetical protein
VNGGGDGCAGDPHIIENWAIDASSARGIYIRTTKYFIIRNCLIENGDWGDLPRKRAVRDGGERDNKKTLFNLRFQLQQ